MESATGYETIAKYDRLYGSVRDGGLHTKPSTIQNVDLTGRTETFIVQTIRYQDRGDYIFVQCMDENAQTIRLALPPKVANAIASQRDSLTARRRSTASKAIANARKERGELPGFLKRKTS